MTVKTEDKIDKPCGQPAAHRVYYAAKRAIKSHATGGNVLIAATVLALVVANVPYTNELYTESWNQQVRLQIGSFNVFSHGGHAMTLLQFINDALMAIFFFTIGLEIKREVLVGELSSLKQAILPVLAAIGGMIVPVGVFIAMSIGSEYIAGAAIPMATDIAFSLGILAMLGRRVPISLKIFLTTLAVVDDIGGIIVIATCYSSHIDLRLIITALAFLGVLMLGSTFKIKSKLFYLGIGTVIWYLFLNSGIHPTIAGVLIAFCVPSTPVFAPGKYVKSIRRAISHFHMEDDESLDRRSMLSHDQLDWLKQIESASDKVVSPLQDLEDSLHPLVNYLIIPLFAFANAGISFAGIGLSSVVSGLSLAIICGLVVGKFVGIFTFSWIAVKLGLAPMPKGSDWRMIMGVSALGGIGFTVSLFIANLSFDSMGAAGVALLNEAKIGIVVGSLLSGLAGCLILKRFLPGRK
ncbi:Na+/H+ antiporter NhaA [uncultured Muribaculum sp.]|uniref:Na+/H+ antiporter NhaA n=1 Tax=uncultured Muribaculum sp. TaxID=1918613 RepID=UPI0025B736DA|nr:Na+/H+ antiporter NhaA [uncultured Muribaculum sp.]